jgi:hypothetical protein
MVWLFVPYVIFPGCLWPPRWSLGSTLGIRIMGLLLRLNELHEGFTHDLAARLLHVLEADGVKFVDFRVIPDCQLLGLDDWYWSIIFILGPLALPREPPVCGIIISFF